MKQWMGQVIRQRASQPLLTYEAIPAMKRYFRIALVAAVGLLGQSLPAQLDVEQAPVLKASEVLPDNLLKGPHHKVREEIRSDGYLNHYSIDSDFGPFEVHSNLMLAIRVREFQALAELERVSRTEVFGKAAIEVGLSPAKAVVHFVKNPVATVTGIPKGIGRLFNRAVRTGKELAGTARDTAGSAADRRPCDVEDEAARDDCKAQERGLQRHQALHARYFKISDSERRWHEKLGTDPYTSNDVLYEAVKSVAWADRLGRFSIKFAGIPSIPGAEYIADVNKVVWSKDPYELEDYNKKVLTDAGVDQASIDKFFANNWFSPTMQTMLIAALAALPDAGGRMHVVKAATNTESEAESRFVLESVVAMTWYDKERSPIIEFQADDYFPVAATGDGRLLVILPVDYLVWTQEMAEMAETVAARHPSDIEPASRELWLLGGISPRARRGMEELDWTVVANQAAVIRATAATTQ